jgi:hypothetical protein
MRLNCVGAALEAIVKRSIHCRSGFSPDLCLQKQWRSAGFWVRQSRLKPLLPGFATASGRSHKTLVRFP